jgi:hypothetical protein
VHSFLPDLLSPVCQLDEEVVKHVRAPREKNIGEGDVGSGCPPSVQSHA